MKKNIILSILVVTIVGCATAPVIPNNEDASESLTKTFAQIEHASKDGRQPRINTRNNFNVFIPTEEEVEDMYSYFQSREEKSQAKQEREESKPKEKFSPKLEKEDSQPDKESKPQGEQQKSQPDEVYTAQEEKEETQLDEESKPKEDPAELQPEENDIDKYLQYETKG